MVIPVSNFYSKLEIMGNSCARSPPPRMTMILSWEDFASWMLSGNRKNWKRDFEVSFALEIEYLDGSVDDIEYYVRHHGLVNNATLDVVKQKLFTFIANPYHYVDNCKYYYVCVSNCKFL